MALIVCPECGKKVSDKAFACPHCGAPIEAIQRDREAQKSTVVVHSYDTMRWAVQQPKVWVYWKGASKGSATKRVGSVTDGDSISFDIADDGEVLFNTVFKQASVHVETGPGRVTNIKLSFSRMWGKAIPEIVDVETPGD